MKTITIDTNHNRKLGCPYILHIARAPKQSLSESELGAPYIIKTADDSAMPEQYILRDLIRFPLSQTPDFFATLSHGMSPLEFATYAIDRGWQLDTPLAAYLFTKKQPGT